MAELTMDHVDAATRYKNSIEAEDVIDRPRMSIAQNTAYESFLAGCRFALDYQEELANNRRMGKKILQEAFDGISKRRTVKKR